LTTILRSQTNPIVEQTPSFLVSAEGPTAVEDTIATIPQTPTNEAITGIEPIAKPGPDQRKSRRRTVPKVRQSCKVKVGIKVLSALLVNESHGGFAILIDHLDSLTVGKKIELHTDMGGFLVRIVYIKTIARPKDATAKCDSWFQLGMKKIGGSFPL
jgi:hypothetical protein